MAFNPNDYLIDLKGKKYLQVPHRVMWFREVHPKGVISTEILHMDGIALARATISTEDGQVLGTGHGTAAMDNANAVWRGRSIEKAETAAIGRALAHAGFGTQFAVEDEEDDHLADSPQAPRKPTTNGNGAHKTPLADPDKPKRIEDKPSGKGLTAEESRKLFAHGQKEYGMEPDDLRRALGVPNSSDYTAGYAAALALVNAEGERMKSGKELTF